MNQEPRASRRNFLRVSAQAAGMGILPNLSAGEKPSLEEFVGLSFCLTELGVGSDYPDLKSKYFSVLQAEVKEPILLAVFDQYRTLANQMTPPDKLAGMMLNAKKNKEISDVCKSIMSMWYLGIWQKPGGQDYENKVISSEAYINGMVWPLVQAHPLGYSKKLYGEWGSLPAQGFGPGMSP